MIKKDISTFFILYNCSNKYNILISFYIYYITFSSIHTYNMSEKLITASEAASIMDISTTIAADKCITVNDLSSLTEMFISMHKMRYDLTFNAVTTVTNCNTMQCISGSITVNMLLPLIKFVAYQNINGKLCYTLAFTRNGLWYTIDCCCIMGQLYAQNVIFKNLCKSGYSSSNTTIPFKHMVIKHYQLGYFYQKGGQITPLYIPCDDIYEALSMALENINAK